MIPAALSEVATKVHMVQVRTAATHMCNSYDEANSAIAPGSVHIGALHSDWSQCHHAAVAHHTAQLQDKGIVRADITGCVQSYLQAPIRTQGPRHMSHGALQTRLRARIPHNIICLRSALILP